MNLSEIRTTANIRLRKDYHGNALSPSEFNAFLRIVNRDYFKKKYGLPEEYEKSNYTSRQAWEVARKISDDLRPFLESKDGKINPPLYINSKGIASIPTDYAHVSSILYEFRKGTEVSYIEVDCLNNQDFNSRLSSAILEPSKENPICTFRGNAIQFMPSDLKFVGFDYLRQPIDPEYKYTINSEEIEIYDSANSTELEWPEQCHSDIVNDLVAYVAETLRLNDTKQSAEARKRTGQ